MRPCKNHPEAKPDKPGCLNSTGQSPGRTGEKGPRKSDVRDNSGEGRVTLSQDQKPISAIVNTY